jgi:uncharacterized protein (TIGR03083 family)
MQSIVAEADLDAPVPTCPGWSMRDLVVHTGQVHRHKTASVSDDWTSGPAPWPDGPESNVVEWFDEGIDEMLGVFATADLGAPSWTWCSHDHNVEWWVRRMALETLIHGADAALAVGELPVIDEVLATDGVEELLVEMMVGAPSWAELAERDQVVALVTPQKSWVLRTATWAGESPKGQRYEDEHGLTHARANDQPDTVIMCTASELDLWLWGRGALPGGTVAGDDSLKDLVRSIAIEATQ